MTAFVVVGRAKGTVAFRIKRTTKTTNLQFFHPRPSGNTSSHQSSQQRFPRTAFLLHHVGKTLQTRKPVLYNLCLTNKLFNVEFCEWLYLYVDHNLDRIDPANISLALAKHITIDGWHLNERVKGCHESLWSDSKSQHINRSIRRLVYQMPSLESLM